MKIGLHRNISILFIFVFLFSLIGLNGPVSVVRAETLPEINVWYGLTQTFGNIGNPQGQIAILGNVSADAVTLEYSLNGSALKPLTIGPDNRRLENVGDFAVELFDIELKALPETNTVEIVATGTPVNPEDPTPTTTVTVTVNYERYRRPTLPYSITNWGSFTTNSQVVDGKWLTENTKLYTDEPGYDRMVAIGSMEWQDYEVTAEIKPLGIDPSCVGYDCGVPSYTPGIGLIARWTGHTDLPAYPDVINRQPKSGWLPLGAIGWYRWNYSGGGALGIYHDESTSVSAGSSTLSFGTTYVFKFRVETLADGSPFYSLKVWNKTIAEPPGWDLTWQGAPNDPRSGSVVLFSHHVNAEFGAVTVTQVNPPVKSDIVYEDFNVCSLDPTVWELYTPVNVAETSMYISGAFSGDAKLNISIPGGLVEDHNPDVNDNNAARVRQVITDDDFHVEAKFTSAVNQQYQMQGIMVEGVDPNNFMRFEFYSDGADTYLYARSFAGTESQTYVQKVIGVAGINPLYLAVYRSGDRWITGYSLNGTNWFTSATFPYMMVVDKIGLYAGNASGTSAPAHTVSVDYFKDRDDKTFTDDLELNSISLSYVGNGSVMKNPDSTSYTCGQSVELTANADEGYSFTEWGGDLTGGVNPATVIMNGPKSITALFSINSYQLDVTKTGTGSGTVTSSPAGINCGTDCSETYEYGTDVTLTAVATAGSTFTGWSGGGCSGTGTCVVTLDAAKTVSANFVLGSNILSVEKTGTGSGLVTSVPAGIDCGDTCAASFDNGTTVILTAMASTGSTFTGWTGAGCSGTGTCVVTISDFETVTANFILNTYALSVTKTGEGSGTIVSSPAGINCGLDCSETYDYGTLVTLTAVADYGSSFTGWTGAGCSGTGTCAVTMDSAKTVIANFIKYYEVFLPLINR